MARQSLVMMVGLVVRDRLDWFSYLLAASLTLGWWYREETAVTRAFTLGAVSMVPGSLQNSHLRFTKIWKNLN